MSQSMNPSVINSETILIMAGGTGGHVFPALATAERLRASGLEVEWLGTAAGIESDLVPKAGIKLNTISVAGLRGKGKLSLLLAPLKVLRALVQAIAVLRQVKPVAVLGMGGFASGPGGLAAWLLGIPLLIHEQNAIPGMTNKLLSKFSRRVMAAFPGAFPNRNDVICTGNPIRQNIVEVKAPSERFSSRQGALRVLVVGGSLGALAINELLPQALAAMNPEQRPQMIHQAGKRNIDSAISLYQELGVEAEVVAFIDDMNAAYEWADLVICRAGALTVSELCAAGVASILVPFPHAVDDHQTENARYISDQQAGVLLPQSQMSVERIVELLTELNDRNKLQAMAEKARSLGQGDASDLVAEQCLQFTSGVSREG
ncbi:MAG: undecaprenyldiphospho-muramoylpentapeptide beta-N-acetylglucosaminyltransferase [Motiliproteus sp.]|nr:undecaprenyldiphospho-muramoylpentapeptide beta-N-acetylglucosaminyltransferase [Motiliproteus sp.]MCW9051702.1 undecaprenyldiphospho-muramoylpentapeptide beta-N-acetylglucosaminyltransferase [Motiliproteus sp.]